jgi:hypothetical protein
MKRKNSSHVFKTKFITEMLYFVIVLTIFAVVGLVSYNVYADVNNEIQNSPDMSNTSKTTIASSYARFDDVTDGSFLTLFVFMWLVILGLAWLSYENQLFLIILVVFLIAMLITGAIFSNMWSEFSTDADIGALSVNLPFTTQILDNFVMYWLVFIGSAGLVLFMRSKY